ncbi:sensor histidine kinase [Duganella sacchari]|nr:sensor histidine kinase [Duganella sacchari]
MIIAHIRRLTLMVLLLASALAAAAPAMPLLSDFNHKAWGVLDGAPVDVMKFAQTTDGWLWIATPTGLWRYDGVRFERVDSVYGHPLQSNILIGLAATPDGALLVGYQLGGVSVFRKGYTRTYTEADGLPNGIVYHIEPAPDGSVWVGTRSGAARLLPGGGKVEQLGANVGLPELSVFQILFSRNGTQWIATIEGMYYRRPGASNFTPAWPHTQLYAMGEAPDGTIWACDPHNDYYRVSTSQPGKASASARPELKGRGMRFDRDGVMWLLLNEGIERKLDFGPSSPAQKLTPQNGLSGSTPGAIFQDREGSIWIGTATGVDRLRPNRLKPVLPELQLEGPAMLHGPAGELWIGDIWNGLRSVNPDGTSRLVENGRIGASHWAGDGTLWYSWNKALRHRTLDGKVTAIAPPDGFKNRLMHAIQSTRHGDVWVSYHGRDLFKVVNGVWIRDGGLQGMPREMTTSMAMDAQGTVWLGHANNTISLVSEQEQGSTLKRLDGSNGLGAGIIMQLYRDGNAMWVGGERGVYLYRDGRFAALEGKNNEVFRGVSGIVRLPDGELWLHGADGIYRINAGAVAAWLQDSRTAVDFERFDALDGLRGHAQQLPSNPSLMRTRDGQLWFTTDYTVASIDPSHVRRNPVPPPVYIRGAESGGKKFLVDDVKALVLPKGSKQLTISFTALSLSIPERVRFQYRLVGLEDQWEEPVGRREAYYTNLPPGNYRFEVIAANEDGVWNTQGAALDISIPPTFVQTPWFMLLVALGIALLGYAAYQLRVRVIKRRMQETFWARMAERSRIARALHDTLLQSVQGLIMTFQSFANKYEPGSRERERMEKSLDMAEQLLTQGRDQIMDLRASSSSDDLGLTLGEFGKGQAEHGAHAFSVRITGTPCRLRSKAYEEIYAIGREALFNAARYAEADNIWLELHYTPRLFTLKVKDNGRGLDHQTLSSGQSPGHWGLVGMRERAESMKAQLSILSQPGEGTEVVLTVKARNAYEG